MGIGDWGLGIGDWGLVRRLSACTEDISTLVPGYSLDDEYTYLPTYGIVSSQAVIESSAVTTPDINLFSRGRDAVNYSNLQYSSIAYDENRQKVSGNYFGRYNKENHSITFLNNADDYFKNGYGCAFKPLPYGEVLFMFYDDSNNHQNMLDIISTERPDADYGILYPSFIYPVMRRPFYVSGDIFIWSQDVLKSVSGGTTLNDIYHDKIENGIKSECSIHNGITIKNSSSSKRNFDSASWFAGLNPTDFLVSGYTNDNDLYGMTYREPNDRIIKMDYYKGLSGLNQSDTSVVGFYIKEGCPTNCSYSEYANEISYLFEGGFAKNFYILRDQDDKSKIINIIPTEGSDSTISYYLAKYQNKQNNIRFIVDADDSEIGGNKYIMMGEGGARIVLCRFEYMEEYADDYDIDLYESLYGEYVVVGMEYIIGNDLRIQFNWRDSSGAEQYYNRVVQSLHTIYLIDDDIETLQSYFHLPLTGIEDRRILKTPSENGVNKTWRQMIYSHSINKYSTNHFNHTYVQEDSGNVLFGIGRKVADTPNGGKLNI